MDTSSQKLLKTKLNSETAKISWLELQRFFAQGVVICVDESKDLVEVANEVALDNKTQVQEWINSGCLSQVSNTTAQHWVDQRSLVWAVVVAPWVLVQACRDAKGSDVSGEP